MKVEDKCSCGGMFSYCTMFPVDRIHEYELWLEAHSECRDVSNRSVTIHDSGGRRDADKRECRDRTNPKFYSLYPEHKYPDTKK